MDHLEEAVYRLTQKLSTMAIDTLEMTTKTLQMTAKLDVILDRLSALTSTPSSPKSPPTIAPRSAPLPLAASHHPEPKIVAPMALLTLLRFRLINRHFQPSHPLLLSVRTAHRHEIPYGNDVIRLGDAVVKHQIHPRWVWILSAVETQLCSVCHRRRLPLPHSPPSSPPPPPKPPPPPPPRPAWVCALLTVVL
ncbi:hypothetical protein JHK87_039969 [Glycine soja]|nr:hypothetical protein JHK87_039969 [Glycine soja]